VLEAALINTDVIIENPADDTSLWRIDGRPLEVALVMAAAEHKVLLSEIKIKSKTLEVKPFNSTQKYSATQVQIGERKHWNYLGAPEILLELVGLESNERAKILEKMDELAYSGSRVLGVARDKTFLGLIAFRDSPRLGVAEALHRADLAGVRTVVVTGDHRGTAESLVKELGIEIGAHAVIEGGAMRDLSDAEMRKRLPHLKVFARMTPQDKLRLANLYREMGEVVAMTGDGVNDAPAIKNADIGIALGSGTEIAKGAADLVILDDNFETIVAAIEEGRRILSNVKKVIVYLLSNSFDSLLLIGGSVLLGIALPLNALQILWVNFFTDSFPGVAFAFEDGEDYLKEAPTKMNKRIFDGELKFFVLGLGGLSSVLLLALYVVLLRQGIDPELVRTFIFAIFSMYSLFLAFSVRHLRISILKYNIFSNPYLLGSVVVGICLSLAAIYLPFLQNILGTISLPLPWLAGVLGFSLFNILIFELAKSLFHKTKKAR